jgi:hypothetical protein
MHNPKNFTSVWLLTRSQWRPNGTLHASDGCEIFCSSGMRDGEVICGDYQAPICRNCVNKMRKYGYYLINNKWQRLLKGEI